MHQNKSMPVTVAPFRRDTVVIAKHVQLRSRRGRWAGGSQKPF